MKTNILNEFSKYTTKCKNAQINYEPSNRNYVNKENKGHQFLNALKLS